MANLFTFRVDVLEGVTHESMKSFLATYTTKHVIAHEISDLVKKEHYQGWIYTDLKKQNFALKIKSTWPILKGRVGGRGGKYSVAAIKNFQNYQRYVCKGKKNNPPNIAFKQIGIDEIIDTDELHRQYWAYENIDENGQSKPVHIYDKSIEHFENYSWNEEDDTLTRRSIIAKYMLSEMKLNSNKQINSYGFRNWLNAITLRLVPSYEEFLLAEVLNRI